MLKLQAVAEKTAKKTLGGYFFCCTLYTVSGGTLNPTHSLTHSLSCQGPEDLSAK